MAAAPARTPLGIPALPMPDDRAGDVPPFGDAAGLTGTPSSADEDGSMDDAAHAWASVDMEAIRKALPDNTYWKMAVPTKNPEVIRAREAERERMNVEYGKVLSNTATAEEVDTYYAQRQRLSQDYLEFIVYLLTNYGYQIPPRDVAALKLAAEMHNARLEEFPRKIAEAHERREAHEAARRAWLEQQQAFNENGDHPE